MEIQRPDTEESFEHIDADAVCEACSTVNPAGTLLCKTCGNNLRDQRARRLASDVALEPAADAHRPRRVLTGLLTIFGLLAILWAGINVLNGNIDRWLTEGMTASPTASKIDPNQFWSGPDARLYNSLSDELDAKPVTAGEAANVASGLPQRDTFDGRYVIKYANGPGGALLGGAIVRTQNGEIHFVAHLNRNLEIRGKGTRTDDNQIEAAEVGVQIGSTVYDAYGIARLQADGHFVCTGMLTDGDKPYTAVADYIP